MKHRNRYDVFSKVVSKLQASLKCVLLLLMVIVQMNYSTHYMDFVHILNELEGTRNSCIGCISAPEVHLVPLVNFSVCFRRIVLFVS